ncbi:hypothetical protein SEA_GOURDTHYMES_104 [Gordonia phage GourdThymes]|uniref:Uncharacterized protein n=1 Tax=Gordonia phage Gorko TaxID=2571248 RepID=A0A4Y6EGV1_9CAUD|nr:hypothetical protein SEA_GORKO_103 [Gordonia phage Gorko]QOP64757.1 hypothetical protein SEA_GOURDTHYMES_104 [Gordonia phage GourdThymes]QRI45581.1 hypothetical protein SEA_EKHEIN_109 [Gordonia phage Ekhein]
MFDINAKKELVIDAFAETRTEPQTYRVVACLEYMTNVGWELEAVNHGYIDDLKVGDGRCIVMELYRNAEFEIQSARVWIDAEGIVQSDQDRDWTHNQNATDGQQSWVTYYVGDRQAF